VQIIVCGALTSLLRSSWVYGVGGKIKLERSGGNGNDQWKINPDPMGIRDIQYVQVKNSNNISSKVIDPLNSTNGGNTTMWFKPAPRSNQNEGETWTPLTDNYIVAPWVEVGPIMGIGINVALADEIVNTSQATDIGDEEFLKRYKKDYPKGKYKTVIIVYEGRVVVADYNDKGPDYKNATDLPSGNKADVEGDVK
jgi:hypothetical protein